MFLNSNRRLVVLTRFIVVDLAVGVVVIVAVVVLARWCAYAADPTQAAVADVYTIFAQWVIVTPVFVAGVTEVFVTRCTLHVEASAALFGLACGARAGAVGIVGAAETSAPGTPCVTIATQAAVTCATRADTVSQATRCNLAAHATQVCTLDTDEFITAVACVAAIETRNECTPVADLVISWAGDTTTANAPGCTEPTLSFFAGGVVTVVLCAAVTAKCIAAIRGCTPCVASVCIGTDKLAHFWCVNVFEVPVHELCCVALVARGAARWHGGYAAVTCSHFSLLWRSQKALSTLSQNTSSQSASQTRHRVRQQLSHVSLQ